MQTISKFYKLVFEHKGKLLLAFTLFGLASVCEMYIPFAIKEIVNSSIESNFTIALRMASLVLVFKSVEILMTAFGFQVSEYINDSIQINLRLKVFRKMQELDFAYHSNKSSGALISLFKRGEGALTQFYMNMNVFNIMILFDFIALLIVFVSVYHKLAIVTLIVIILNALFMFFSISNNIQKRKRMHRVDDLISNITVDNMIGFETVKYFAKEQYEYKRLSQVLKSWFKAAINYSFAFRIIDLGNGGIIGFGMLAVILISVLDLMHGKITIGDFTLASSFAVIFFPRLINMVFNFREVVKNFTDLENYFEVLDIPVEIQDGQDEQAIQKWAELEGTGGYDIEFNNVSFRYAKGENVLEEVNFKVDTGMSIALVGKSGAGKTTLVRLLLRFFDPSNGEILIGGINIRDIPKSMLRQQIGFVPQDPVMFNNTIGYNLAYSNLDSDEEEIMAAAKVAHLYDFIKTLPEGLETMVGERGIKLSGGQRQRLSIARVILANTPIVVLDEATSNLDSESEGYVQQAFWELAKSKTTIVIAHRLSTVMKANYILVLDNGKIIEEGTHVELTSQGSGLYKQLWDLQTKGEIERD